MLRSHLLSCTVLLALAAPFAGSAAVAEPSPRMSQVDLTDEAQDVWVWSPGTSSWELWGTKADADILSATVTHGAHAVRVVMTFDNLRKQRAAGYLVRVQTKKMVRSAWVRASDKAGWAGKHVLLKGDDKVVAPGFEHKIDYTDDTVVMTLPRALFDKPAWVKVLVRNDLSGDKDFTDNPHTGTQTPVFTDKIHAP